MIVDVGAQFGTSFRAYLDHGWRVVAFEPDAAKWPKLAKYNSHPSYTLIRKAVGDTVSDAAAFYTSAESTGIASLLPFRPSHQLADPVPLTTLAAELPTLGVSNIDFLKIDTEGYDLHVLRGHDWTHRPEVLMCEMDEVKTRLLGHDYHALGRLLLDQGYVVWLSQWAPLVQYGSGHAWHSIKPYPCELHHADAWGNFIAVRDDASVATMRDLIRPHS